MKDLMDYMYESRLCTDEMFSISEELYVAIKHQTEVPSDILKVLNIDSKTLVELSSLTRLDEIMHLVHEELPWLIEHRDNDSLTYPQVDLLNAFALLHECSHIKGYKELSLDNRKWFLQAYKTHQSEIEDKSYQATGVELGEGCLKVTFKNGDWLHYNADGTRS